MAGERLPSRFSLRSQLWFWWTGKCFAMPNVSYTYRWATNKKSQSHKQAHLVFADIPISIGTNAEKTKRAFFLPTRGRKIDKLA